MPAPEQTSAAAKDRRVNLPILLFAGAALSSGFLLVILGSRISFSLDHWDVLLHRPGSNLDVYLDPHNQHTVIAPMLVFKAIQQTFGMDSLGPFQFVSIATFLASVVLLFIYLRRRVGDWLALAGVVLILFLGAAHDDLLLAFQIGFFGSMACGLGALLALERGDRRGDGLACLLLVASLSFSSLGLPFVAGAAVEAALGPNLLRRAYIVVVPSLLYGLWWLGWGQEAPSNVSLDNLGASLGYVIDGFGSSLSSLLGLAPSSEEAAIDSLGWGRILLVVGLAVAALRLRVLPRVPKGLWIILAVALTFWLLAALNAIPLRAPTSSRYQYIGAVFVLMIGAELFRGVRPGPKALTVVFVCVAAASLGGIEALRDGYRSQREFAIVSGGGLAALEVAADSVASDFTLTKENSNYDSAGYLDAGSYLSAADEFGSPAYDPAELTTAPEPARVAADKVLASALELRVEPVRGGLPGACLTSPGQGTEPRILSLPSGGAALELPAGAEGRLRRYASESFPVELESLPKGETLLEIPTDRSTEPWELELVADGPVSVCPL